MNTVSFHHVSIYNVVFFLEFPEVLINSLDRRVKRCLHIGICLNKKRK